MIQPSSVKRSEILFITPVIPNVNGGGPEKRAHNWVTELKKKHDVEILFIGTQEMPIGPLIREPIKGIKLNYPSRYRKFKLLKSTISILLNQTTHTGATAFGWLPLQERDKVHLKELYGGKAFKKIVCFRIFCSEFAIFLKQITDTNSVDIDVDDLEPETRLKLAKLYARNRQYLRSIRFWFGARQYYLAEDTLSAFNQVYVCSTEDRNHLLSRRPSLKVSVFKNKIFRVEREQTEAAHCRSILFVGTLSYFPNEHAITWFLRNVFAKLYAEDSNWNLTVVGFSPSAALKEELNAPGVRFYSNLKSIDEAYNESAIVIAPLFAGGGTKLKVIEAMSFNKPVIATAEAVHGLALENGTHYLLAETADTYLKYCKMLAKDVEFYQALTTAAYQKYVDEFSYSI